ncbi:MAG: hypothetical protein FWC66_04055 [Oscillospiraceae bacterium]|nr:hypothetical protein [Oscillospiraceae bacterium]
MRKFVRDNILDLLPTIKESLEYAVLVDDHAARMVISDGWDALAAISQLLEQGLTQKSMTKYLPLLGALKNSFQLLSGGICDADAVNNTLDKMCIYFDHISQLLEVEKSIKKEIVFFPYKASMWDCMESVWEAAQADDRCFVTVVPIPYFDKDKNGNFATYYYEGNYFPDYVDVTFYKNFNIEAIKPDIAYIHNPYDDRNYVTSVHPSYYSRRLKEHVQTLVFVPYYVSQSTPGPALAASASIMAADAIVAYSQSEARAYRIQGARCKIAALGSPKIDKILSFERNMPEIPDKWSILKGKKIFFFNTSIASLLRFGANYMRKIRAVVNLFERRNDAALIWRPHPLTLSTITSMRPELLGEYALVENMTTKLKNTIVDDTHDMSLALALADAYIGDVSSSLVCLFAITGKPLFMLNFNMPIAPTEEELICLSATDALSAPCVDGKHAWVFCTSVNAMCTLDLSTGRATVISSVPVEANAPERYGQPVKKGNTLLFPPMRSMQWAEYDIQSRTWNKYPLPQIAQPVTQRGACLITAFDTTEYAIFAPFHSKAFSKYDKVTGEISYHADWYDEFKSYVYNPDYGLFGSASKLIEESLFFPSKQANIVLELNVISMKTKIHKVGVAHNKYHGITFDGESFWLTKHLMQGTYDPHNSVVRWNKDTGVCKEFLLEPITKKAIVSCSFFRDIIYSGGKIWIFPYGASEIFHICPKTETVKCIETGLPYPLGDRQSPYYSASANIATTFFLENTDHQLMLFSYFDNSLLLIDTLSEKVEKINIYIDGIEHLLKSVHAPLPYLHLESAFITTSAYIDKVCSGFISEFDPKQSEYHKSLYINSDGSCGKKIHEYFLRHIC